MMGSFVVYSSIFRLILKHYSHYGKDIIELLVFGWNGIKCVVQGACGKARIGEGERMGKKKLLRHKEKSIWWKNNLEFLVLLLKYVEKKDGKGRRIEAWINTSALLVFLLHDIDLHHPSLDSPRLL